MVAVVVIIRMTPPTRPDSAYEFSVEIRHRRRNSLITTVHDQTRTH